MNRRIFLLILLSTLLTLTALPLSAEVPPELFTAANQVRTAQGSISASADRITVSVDFSLLRPEGAERPQLRASLPGRTVTLKKDRMENRGADNYTWSGTVEGHELSTVVMTVVDGVMYGHIDFGGNDYSIEPQNGDYLIVKKDPSGAVPFGDDVLVPPVMPQGKTAETVHAASAEDGSRIDVLVLYTQEMQTRYGSGLNALIQGLVDTANAAYANSGISTRLRLTGSVLYANSQAAEGVPLDSALKAVTLDSQVAAQRDAYAADLVSLLRVFHQTEADGCGLSWIMQTNDGGFSPFAFSVVKVGADGPYYCHNTTFVHELAHNMGCAHDRANANGSTGVYPYSFGYTYGPYDGVSSFGTIMSYWRPVITYFSTPLITYQGVAIGISGGPSGNDNPTISADNTRTINNTRTTVANFRQGSDSTCSYSISQTSRAFPSTGGSGSLNVIAGGSCSWTASSSASWIIVTSGGNGIGNGSVNYSVSANAGSGSRTGNVTIAGQAFTVTQTGTGGQTCNYTITPISQSFDASAGEGTITMTVESACNWTVSTDESWISVTSGSNGIGNGTVNYAVSANSGASSRTGTIALGGKIFTVTQSGEGGQTCRYAMDPTFQTFGASGGTGIVTIAAPDGCSWKAEPQTFFGISLYPWIKVTSGDGSGNGIAIFAVDPNASPYREGVISIAGRTFIVSQEGSSDNPEMQMPTAQELIQYAAPYLPQKSTLFAEARPIGLGPVAAGGDVLRIQIGLYQFSEPVDLYFGIYAPHIDPSNVYILTDGNLQRLSPGSAPAPWKRNVSSSLNETLSGDISTRLIPPGSYTLFLAVTPFNGSSFERFCLWATSFSVVSK